MNHALVVGETGCERMHPQSLNPANASICFWKSYKDDSSQRKFQFMEQMTPKIQVEY